MNLTRFYSLILSPVRFLVVAFACTLIFFSSALPAAAIVNSPSSPYKGEEHLNEIQKRTDQAVIDPPLSLKEIQKGQQAQKGGLNEVQGAADLNKMSTPENSGQATSVIDEVKEALRNFNNHDDDD